MHRQSLGSPVSKLHNSHGGAGKSKEEDLIVEDQKRKDQSSSLLTTTDDDCNDAVYINKSQNKAHKSPLIRTERFIHIIPILTVFCFLILYLSSHDPSLKDLAQFNGFKRTSKNIDLAQFNGFKRTSKTIDFVDSTEIDDFGKFAEIEKGDVLAIRSLRNLKEIERRDSKIIFHRKIGAF